MIDIWNNPEYLKKIAQDILHEAALQGASAAEVDIGVNKGYSVTVRNADAESVEYHQDKIIELTVYFGQRSGSASISDLRQEAIQAAVKAACNIAKFTDEDPFAGLAPKELLAFDYQDLNLSHPWNISVEDAIALACECEAIALAKDKRITAAENVAITTTAAWHVYANSNGFIGSYPATRHEISCVLIAKAKHDMQRNYYYTTSCDHDLLESVTHVANQAVTRTIQRLGAKRLATQKVPVIYDAEEARGFLGHFVSAISGGNLYRKSSFLYDKLGETLFPKHIKIDERPFLPKSLGSAPFDGEGVKTRENVFIDQGVLKSYALGSYSARKLGMETTGNAGGVHNLFVSHSDMNLPALLKKMHTGLYVTELMGQGLNLLTGDYSRGAAGFWVENGELQYPVEEITIAGNLQKMYSQIEAIGNDVETRGNIRTGSILLSEVTIAGD
jgi:PmbA protein